MPLIKFEDYMLTHLPSIDDQHKELINRINKLYTAMNEGHGSETVVEILKFLEIYVIKHFSEEENYMEQYDCPIKEENKQAHKVFIDKLKFFETKLSEGSLFVSLDVYKDLFKWFVNHIQTIDQKMAAYVR